MCQYFEQIQFAEARPMSEAATLRPVVPPLSLVTSPTRRGKFFDVALEYGPCLIDGTTPVFAPDWKHEDQSIVRQSFGWPSLPRERRTRTAIEATTGRALDESLFSYDLILPQRRCPDGSVESFVWETSVNGGHLGIPENHRAIIVAELADLLTHGLPGIGKTRATAEVEWLAEPSPRAVAETTPS
jgi:hypothetical protein